jgi:hypothetical protein
MTKENVHTAYRLVWPDSSRILSVSINQRYIDLSLTISGAALQNMEGPMGETQVDSKYHLQNRSGEIVYDPVTRDQFYGRFANSWRVTGAESLFDYGAGQDTNTFTLSSFPSDLCSTEWLPPDICLTAQHACEGAGISNRDVLDECSLDVGATGDLSFVSSYATVSTPHSVLRLVELRSANATAMNGGCSISVRAPSHSGLVGGLCLTSLGLCLRRRSKRALDAVTS